MLRMKWLDCIFQTKEYLFYFGITIKLFNIATDFQDNSA